jgi:UTP:GlnB (protein PII) uridylyltransferase
MAAKQARSRKRPAKKSARKSATGKYTKPALRERLKERIQEGDKGGKPGQWSARKSQLLAQAYKKAGGGYRGGKGAPQKSLEKWTAEEWQTQDGATRARRGNTTARYLPKKAWARLSAKEKRATETKKRTASRGGKQFVRNAPAAKRARKKATRR